MPKAKIAKKTGRVQLKKDHMYYVNKSGTVMETKMKRRGKR